MIDTKKIRKQLTEIAEWPWIVYEYQEGFNHGPATEELRDANGNDAILDDRNYPFIAAAPQTISDLCDAVDAARVILTTVKLTEINTGKTCITKQASEWLEKYGGENEEKYNK